MTAGPCQTMPPRACESVQSGIWDGGTNNADEQASCHPPLHPSDCVDGLELLRAACLDALNPVSVESSASTENQEKRDNNLGSRPNSKSLKAEGRDRVFIEEVGEWDVLCGRGGRSNHHSGNKRYREVVNKMKMTYRSTELRSAKTDLSQKIVELVYKYGGRFVKHDKATGRHYLLTPAEARRKTSQALRETKELKWKLFNEKEISKKTI